MKHKLLLLPIVSLVIIGLVLSACGAAQPAAPAEPEEAEPPTTRDLIERGIFDLLRKAEEKEKDGT